MITPPVNSRLLVFVFQLIAILFCCVGANAQLRINEVSQGASGTQEYVELVVVGNRTCTDSCADIRNWILDDNNGWLGSGGGQGIAQGCIRFSNDANWSCVPYGSIIVVFNDGDKNPKITMANDPTDANKDKVYIVPVSSSYIEVNTSTPSSPSSVTYTYPSTGFSSGAGWINVGMANGGDGFIVTAPSNPGQAYHSLGYGSIGNSSNAHIYFSGGAAGMVCYLTDAQYSTQSSWAMAAVASNETPGLGNTAANTQWINSMRTAGASAGPTYNECINPGGMYYFNGKLYSLGGTYRDTFVTALGCDSIVTLNLDLKQPVTVTRDFAGCGSVIYKGNVYSANAQIHDTVRSYRGCDSVYNVANIMVYPINAVVLKDTLSACDKVDYNGTTYTSSATVADTLKNILGCDSIYLQRYINIRVSQPVTVQDSVRGCDHVFFRDKEYVANDVVIDTLRSVYGCDSVYKEMLIKILPRPVFTYSPVDTVICRGSTVKLQLHDIAGVWHQVTDTPFTVFDTLGYDTVIVQPGQRAGYAVVVADLTTRCLDTAYAVVRVDTFDLTLTANDGAGVVRKYSQVALNSGANIPYKILSWSPEALFPNQSAIMQSLVADESQTYTIIGESDNSGCKDTAKASVKVDKEPAAFMPNVFTPNGDGLNDYFGPAGAVSVGIIEFTIYNRWGAVVYNVRNKVSNAIKGWDGTYNGGDAQAGVYVYLISFSVPDGTILNKQGNVTLMR